MLHASRARAFLSQWRVTFMDLAIWSLETISCSGVETGSPKRSNPATLLILTRSVEFRNATGRKPVKENPRGTTICLGIEPAPAPACCYRGLMGSFAHEPVKAADLGRYVVDNNYESSRFGFKGDARTGASACGLPS